MNWFWWAILSAVFAGLTAVLAKVGVKDINSDLATAIRTTVIVILVWAIAAVRSGQRLTEVPGYTWLFLVLSGTATGASWLCYFQALKIGEVSKVAPIDKLSVVVAMLLAVLFLKEPVTWPKCVGGVLIVAGAMLFTLD
jgi:bacterial/archaeal transporter family protein